MSEWRKRLLPASFRGVPFEVESDSAPVGRRTQVHEFVQRDDPVVEDLGRQVRTYKLAAFVIGGDYMAKRDALLAALVGEKPVLVKIAPDLADDDVLAVADLALSIGLDGIIATNTTISREGLHTPAARVEEIGAGGLSGRPLTERSCDVLRLLRGRVGPGLCLIGVGGITTVADAQARLDAGATLLQGYTAFVYEGPLWPRRIVRGVQG